MRALSTILLAAALAQPAGAQVFGAPRDYNANVVWISAYGGSMAGQSMSDKASDASWSLAKSKPVNLALDWGTNDRSIGLRVQRAVPQLEFSGLTCAACRGEVQALTMLGTYRRASPLYTSSLRQVVELAAGVTTWSALKGQDGNTLPTIAPKSDFTYSISLGASLPLGDRLEGSVMYDLMQVRHARQTSGPSGSSSSTFEKLNTLRVGARLRLGR